MIRRQRIGRPDHALGHDACSALERRAGTEWTTVATGTFTQYTDSAVSVDKAYAYRVKAYNANGAMIGESAADIAATIAFTAVTTGMTVSAAPLEELLRGVNAVRSLSGWSNVTWSNILSADDSLPDPGMLILARHLLAIRVRLNEAMHALGVPASGYTDSDVQGLIIAAAHIAEIQNRLR